MSIRPPRSIRTVCAGLLLAACFPLVSCGGGGGDEEIPGQTVICTNCAGASGNARLLCEAQNANKPGC